MGADGSMSSMAPQPACAYSGRFIPVYNAETHGAEHLRGGEHGVGDNRQEIIDGADNRQQLAELGLAGPGGRAPAAPPGLPGQLEQSNE